jgi:endonuclease/exonuclease/phosphatase family metal-dependent hydrolase
MEFKALSYNIHKGLNWNNTSHTLIDLKDFLHETDVDFVFLARSSWRKQNTS